MPDIKNCDLSYDANMLLPACVTKFILVTLNFERGTVSTVHQIHPLRIRGADVEAAAVEPQWEWDQSQTCWSIQSK